MNIGVVGNSRSAFSRSIWDGYCRAFRQLGHDVMVLDENLPQLRETGVLDLLFVIHGAQVNRSTVKLYKSYGVTTAVYLVDEPYEVDRTQGWSCHYDWVFSCDRSTVPMHGDRCVFLPLAYDDGLFCPDGPKIESEILLLGLGIDARKVVLRPLLEEWGSRITWVGPQWRWAKPYGTHIEGLFPPETVARYYRGAKVVLNIHRDSFWSHFGEHNKKKIPATHLNPRTWEAAASGAFQICSPRDDLKVYAPSMPVFRSSKELGKLLDFYLTHDRVREERAQLARQQILPHTYAQRARQILGTLVPVV